MLTIPKRQPRRRLAQSVRPFKKMKTLKTILILLVSTAALGQIKDYLKANQILDSSLIFCGGNELLAQIESSSINYL